MRRGLRPFLILAALLCARPALADPALWMARNDHATVFLFGTVHALRPEAHWDTPQLDAALAQSRELWLEIEKPDDQAAALPLILELGFDPDHPLSKLLDPADAARLREAAKGLPLGAGALEPMRPWLAATVLQVQTLTRDGYAPDRGADITLLHIARESGIPVHGFETLEAQLHILADMPADEQRAYLLAVLNEVGEMTKMVDRIAAAWLSGDIDAAARSDLDEIRTAGPAFYAALITDRNRRFAQGIAEMLNGRGTSLVAVGALHLVGDDSVQAQAAKLGVTFTRLPSGAVPDPGPQ